MHIVPQIARVQRIYSELTQELARKPSLEETASRAKLPVDEVRFLLQTHQESKSIDNSVGSDPDEASFGEFLPAPSTETPLEGLHRDALRGQMDRILESLNWRERQVLKLRFGFEDNQPFTLQEVAEVFQVSRERIRQIETKAIGKLREGENFESLRRFLV